MVSHIIAFVLGIVVATVGLVPMAQIADQGVQKIQQVTKEATK